MRVEQRLWTPEEGWTGEPVAGVGSEAHLVFAFGGRERVTLPYAFEEIRGFYPNARIVVASTAGEIHDTRVTDDCLSLTALRFDSTQVHATAVSFDEHEDIEATARRLVRALPAEGLAHVVVVSDGLKVNGTLLARGLRESVPDGVVVTGGLAGDGERMVETAVGLDATPTTGTIVAIGFYGERLRVGHGSLGGWDPFGPHRLITRSDGRILYELDGKSALELYKTYLMDEVERLPWSAWLYPLELRVPDREEGLVRSVLGVDEEAQSLIFAGDVPEGTYARMMKANFDRLVTGAVGAAQQTRSAFTDTPAEFALLISCVGRKMILRQRTEEEIEGVREVLGGKPALAGFYSYGEICPQRDSVRCELHNQTMTITTFTEV